MADKKKLTTAAVAVAASAALLLGGTFAWQSISQTALNEASDVINPGGRLHDDFYIDENGDYNADIYVENFAEDDIFARVRLAEYMEVVINYGGGDAEIVETVAGTKSLNDTVVTGTDDDAPTDNTSGYTYEYVTHYFDQTNATDDFWDWTMGSEDSETVYYMPTFNKNKDSFIPDRNGMYVDRIGGISNRSVDQYDDYTVWTKDDATDIGTEIYDIDANTVDEVGYDFDNLSDYEAAGNIAIVADETHTAQPVGTTYGFISMDQWLGMVEYDDDGNVVSVPEYYWVYDTDGWIYWSSPIGGGETTGLLLDAIELDDVMDDTWYYAIEATGQFVTAGDLGDGSESNPGFVADGMTDEAKKLLELIGAGEASEKIEEETFTATAGTLTGSNISLYFDSEYISIDEATNTITVNGTIDEWDYGVVTLSGDGLDGADFTVTENKLYRYNEETGEYDAEGTDNVDIECYAEDGDDPTPWVDIYCSPSSEGKYKIVSIYDDTSDGTNEWEGSIEFTIVSGGETDDGYGSDPTEVYFLKFSYETESNTFESAGYLEAGDSVDVGIHAYFVENNQNVELSDGQTEWSISGQTSDSTTIDEEGVLTIGNDEKDLSIITITATYTTNDGNVITDSQQVIVSDEAVTLTLTVAEADTYYTGKNYGFTVTATSGGETVQNMEYTYSIVSTTDKEGSYAEIDNENLTFCADNADTYYVRAWSECLRGKYAEATVTVAENPNSGSSTGTYEMTIKSSRTIKVDEDGDWSVQIAKTRDGLYRWNLYDLDGTNSTFELASNNSDIYFTYDGDEETGSTGTDLWVMIPTSVTKDFTVTVTNEANGESKTIDVIVSDVGIPRYIEIWTEGSDIENTNPAATIYLSNSWNDSTNDGVYWFRVYDANGTAINNALIGGNYNDTEDPAITDFTSTETTKDDGFTSPYYEWQAPSNTGGDIEVWIGDEVYYFIVDMTY